MNLNAKIIILTGGYGHLGRAVAKSLARNGAVVYVLGRHQEKFSKAFENTQENIFFLNGDISSSESIKRCFSKVYNERKRIDVLINGAFYSKGNSPEELTNEEWSNGIDGTLTSVFYCIREVMPYMKRQKSGKIINMSSMYGFVAPDFEVYDDASDFINPPHYGAAKAGVIQLTKYYASFLGRYGITVNCVSPGPFPSESVQSNIDFVKKLERRTLLGRVGRPDDLAGVFVFLSSNTSDYITGQNIIVDGGWTVR